MGPIQVPTEGQTLFIFKGSSYQRTTKSSFSKKVNFDDILAPREFFKWVRSSSRGLLGWKLKKILSVTQKSKPKKKKKNSSTVIDGNLSAF